jgi:predicted amidohydrolase
MEAAPIHSIHVLATIHERCSVPNRVYDTALWIDRSGKIAEIYQLHLYDALGFKESDKFLPAKNCAAHKNGNGSYRYDDLL